MPVYLDMEDKVEGRRELIAGINHMGWLLKLEDKEGNDLYPEIKKRALAMNAEMKSAKWLWGGIGLQFAVGYSISYLVYTIGTLIVNPGSLAIGPAIAGGIAVCLMAGIIISLII